MILKKVIWIWIVFGFIHGGAWCDVSINEVMYHAPNSELEYIELYNSDENAILLTGWKLKDRSEAHTWTFPLGASIAPHGFLVITNKDELFQQAYGFAADFSGLAYHLSNEGDVVRLFDDRGNLLEALEYDDHSPWPELADGLGASLERKNAILPANLAVSWAASTGQGTPGKTNSVHVDQIPPFILDIHHSPRIPQPNDPVTITAQVLDLDGSLQSVRLYYGWNRGTDYQALEMLDDGQHGDGAAGDGTYGGTVEGMGAGNILRFYLEAQDDDRRGTQLPENGMEEPYMTVVETALTGERVPVLRVVMRPEINEQFLARYLTDDYFPATFYDGDQVYYQVQIRHRGRSRVQNGRFKIRFSPDQLYRGKIRRLNFNGTDTATILREYLSYQLYQDAGLPNMESELVRFHINGQATRGTPYRVAIENPDAQFLHRRDYFEEDDGNLYKTTLDETPDNKATWRYVGENPDLYRTCYIKQTNEEDDDFRDIIRFCRVLSQADPEDLDYMDQVDSVLNADDFLRWMAVSACVAHWDSPFTDHGHNYVLYDNPATGRFNILAWDLNGTFDYTANTDDLNYRKLYTHIRSTKFSAINKILNHPVFGAQYYREIDGLLNSLFSQTSMNQRIDAAGSALQLNSSSVQFLKTYVKQRIQDLSAWINQNQGVAFISKPIYQVNVGESYRYHAVAVDYQHNQSISYTLMQKPDWLSVDSKTGILTGVPPEEGRFAVILEAQSKRGTNLSQEFTLQAVDPKPRLLLTFNETGDTASDLSEYAHPVQFHGSNVKTEGRLGNGISLGTRNSYLEIPDDPALDLTGAVTVEAWIRPNSIGDGNPVILTKGDEDHFNYTLMLGYGPYNWDAMEPCFMPHRFDIENRVYYGRKEIEAQLQRQQWVHIAGTYDSQEERVCVYANNRRIVESSNRSRMVENSSSLQIGLAGSRSFQGVVDDIKILPFAKQAFAAGLCLSQVDVSTISSALDRIALSLSPYRMDAIDTGDYCIHVEKVDEWLALPKGTLSPGKTVSWWMDDLGMPTTLWGRESIALYPVSQMGNPGKEFILDKVEWGSPLWGMEGPLASDPGVQAGLWLPGRTVQITQDMPVTLSLRNFSDNDEMDQDWQVQSQKTNGPVLQSFTIEDGLSPVRQRDVHLHVSAENPQSSWKMRISNFPEMWSPWVLFTETVDWQLPGDNGPKTVYVQLMDTQGERSKLYSASVSLDIPITRIPRWPVYHE